jgi:dTDP-4-amino-4,6-dideoxygalactose transaminase
MAAGYAIEGLGLSERRSCLLTGVSPSVYRYESKRDDDDAWHLYPLLIRPEALTIDRDTFIEELKAQNIGVSVLYRPLHMHTFYQDTFEFKPEDFPNALHVYQRIVNLPISPKMADEDVMDVIAAIKRIVQKYRK